MARMLARDTGSEFRPSHRILEKIATREEADAADLDFRLYDAIEVDALDRLITHQSDGEAAELTIAFVVDGYRVTVGPEGVSIGLREAAETSGQSDSRQSDSESVSGDSVTSARAEPDADDSNARLSFKRAYHRVRRTFH